MASENGYEAIVSHLIKAGADVNITNDAGKTAFDMAKGNTKITSILARIS